MKIDRMKLQKELDKRNMTQSELINAAHISSLALSNTMNGKGCKAKTALRIAMALDMQIEDLLSEV